jgi:hypothetical protein
MASKVIDGLFIGDAESSLDAEFLALNKISNLINTSGRNISNKFSSSGILTLISYIT